QGGCDRHQQRPRVRRRGQAPPLSGRRGDARLHVSPCSGFDRGIELSVQSAARDAHGGALGPRARHRAESGSDRGGYRGQRAGGEGRGAGAERRIRGGPEVEEVRLMPTVDVVDLNNQKVGELELADEVFGAEVNEALLYEAVRHFQAGQRAGTHKTKVRSEVAGSGKKLWKQKDTGRARMGSFRSPIWRHGGISHGPVPRDYSYKLPRKMLLGALRAALSAKVRDGELKVVQGFTFSDHKTKNAMNALANVVT